MSTQSLDAATRPSGRSPKVRSVAKRTLRTTAMVCVLLIGMLACDAAGAGTRSGSATIPTGAVVPYGAAVKPAVNPISQATDGTVQVAGALRTYRLYVPHSLPRDTPVPLLVALHGGLGSGQQFEQQTDLDGVAEANRFIVVYPNGTPIRPGSVERVWNAGSCCSVADDSHENVNDVGFISVLITQLESRYGIDKNRVFATGHSNGAMLAERLACQLSDQIAAIAVQSGTLVFDQCKPAKPVAVLEIHGTADLNVPINGGIGSDSLTQEDYPPPVDFLKLLAATDKCAPTPTTSNDPSNSAVNFEVWHPCKAGGTVVEWAKVTGANHPWMGHPVPRYVQLLDRGAPYLGFDSSAAVWSFLAAHPR